MLKQPPQLSTSPLVVAVAATIYRPLLVDLTLAPVIHYYDTCAEDASGTLITYDADQP